MYTRLVPSKSFHTLEHCQEVHVYLTAALFLQVSTIKYGRDPLKYDRHFDHASSLQWSTPVLQKLEVPVDVDGNPWPLDENGKPIEREYHPYS